MQVEGTPNLLHIDQMYAYIAVGKEGEGVTAFTSPTMGAMPMVGADEARMLSLRPIAQMLADQSGLPIKLVRFSTREDLDEIEPTREEADGPQLGTTDL